MSNKYPLGATSATSKMKPERAGEEWEGLTIRRRLEAEGKEGALWTRSSSITARSREQCVARRPVRLGGSNHGRRRRRRRQRRNRSWPPLGNFGSYSERHRSRESISGAGGGDVNSLPL